MFVDPDRAHAVESTLVVDQHASSFVQHGVVSGVPRDPERLAIRASVRCWQTIASNAHRIPGPTRQRPLHPQMRRAGNGVAVLLAVASDPCHFVRVAFGSMASAA